ncbi:tetratricopeptide repeat protein [candidate division KSB1 bacterium]|nr:tetratricopeptide repeat protein [candidate division KSB1 bacterium]
MRRFNRSRTLALLLLINIGASGAGIFAQTEAEKKSVSVLFFDFDESSDPTLKWVRWGVSELLCYPLQDVPTIRLVERNRIKSLVDEMNLGQSGVLNEADAITAGKWMGVHYNIFGSVMKTSASEVVILAKIVDVSTGEIIATEKVVGEKNAIQGSLIDLLAEKLIPHLIRREQKSPPAPAIPPTSTVEIPAISNQAEALSHYLQAGYYYNLPNLELAIQEYLEAIKSDPTFVKAYIDLGVLNLQQNSFSNAETYFNQAISIDPQSELAHFNLGLFYGITGKLDQAIQQFSKTLDLNPNYTEVLVELGKAYYKKQNYDAANERFHQVIQLDPQYVAANYYLGVIFRRENLADSAAAQWQKVATNEEPFFRDVKQLALKQLGELALQRRDYPAASEYYTQAMKLNLKFPNPEVQASILCGLGKTGFFQNNYDQAIDYLSAAIGMLPQQPEPHFYLGMSYQALNKIPESIAAFKMTTQCDPNGPFGKKARENLAQLEN